MKWINYILYFFPVKLVFDHFKKNLLLLLIWFMLFGFVGKLLLANYGTAYLFLDPEYLGVVGYFSFQLVGVCFGLFLMTWNTSIYLLISNKYPFMASLKWPFAMFSLNNSILPLTFLGYYVFKIISFQREEMFRDTSQITFSILGLFAGIALVLLITSIFFVLTNKNITGYIKEDADKERQKYDWEGHSVLGKVERVDYFFSRRFRFRPVREVNHYDESLLQKVFNQHHINAFILIIFVTLTLVGLGFFIDNPIFEIPAAGSIFLFFSLITSILGIIYFWTGQWGAIAVIAFILSINYISQFDFFNYNNQAYGLDYNAPPATYSLANLDSISSNENIEKDIQNTEEILNAWLKKQKLDKPRNYKPKMIIIMSSGGGSKASVYTTKVLQMADSLTNGALFNSTFLMTGASGGAIGVSFVRELLLRKQLGVCSDFYSDRYPRMIGKDLLNKICMSLATNDIFYPFQSRNINGYNYVLDRGMMMELALNENTENLLEKTLGDYYSFEKNATIPMLFLNATSVTDSRKIIISPQPISYMMKALSPQNPHTDFEVDAIDFAAFFKDNDPHNLRFLSALRMNATYPLIMPSVSLPSKPQIDVIDAGLRDNYGMEIVIRFLNVFKDWINVHTDGVVILQIRDIEKHQEVKDFEYKAFLSRFLSPLGSLYGNVTITQDYLHDYMLDATNDILRNKIEMIRFEYVPEERVKKASMSFRLTERELESVINTAQNSRNLKSYDRIIELLDE